MLAEAFQEWTKDSKDTIEQELYDKSYRDALQNDELLDNWPVGTLVIEPEKPVIRYVIVGHHKEGSIGGILEEYVPSWLEFGLTPGIPIHTWCSRCIEHKRVVKYQPN